MHGSRPPGHRCANPYPVCVFICARVSAGAYGSADDTSLRQAYKNKGINKKHASANLQNTKVDLKMTVCTPSRKHVAKQDWASRESSSNAGKPAPTRTRVTLAKLACLTTTPPTLTGSKIAMGVTFIISTCGQMCAETSIRSKRRPTKPNKDQNGSVVP